MFQKMKRKREIQNCFLTIRKFLEIEPPFIEFDKPKPLSEAMFFEYFAPYFRETIEECFCATVSCTEDRNFLVQFDTGERMELQLLCKIQK